MISKLTPFIAGFLLALVGAFYYQSSLQLKKHNSAIQTIQGSVSALTLRLSKLQSIDDIKNTHNQFSYYYEYGNWDGLSTFLSDDTYFEQAQDGIFIGQESILKILEQNTTKALNNLVQVQAIVHLSDDGEQGKLRVREFAQLGNFEEDAFWREGIYENVYQKVNDSWKLNQLNFFLNVLTLYDEGWANSSVPIESWQAQIGNSADAPPSHLYESYPNLFIPPFHYSNPVTGRSGTGMEALE